MEKYDVTLFLKNKNTKKFTSNSIDEVQTRIDQEKDVIGFKVFEIRNKIKKKKLNKEEGEYENEDTFYND